MGVEQRSGEQGQEEGAKGEERGRLLVLGWSSGTGTAIGNLADEDVGGLEEQQPGSRRRWQEPAGGQRQAAGLEREWLAQPAVVHCAVA